MRGVLTVTGGSVTNAAVDATTLTATSTVDAANTIDLAATGGTTATVRVRNTAGTGNASIDVTSTSGGVTVTAGTSVYLAPGTGDVDVGGKKVVNSAAPTSGGDLATKTYVDGAGTTGPETKNKTLGTGVISGGVLSLVGAPDAGTTYGISDGSGIIVNPTTGAVTDVTWSGLTGQSTTYSGILTYVSINSGGTPVYATSRPSHSTTRDQIFLGVLVHVGGTNLTTVNNEQHTQLNVGNQLYDFMDAIGFLNLSGNELSAASTDLTFVKAAGSMFAHGSNYDLDAKDPHIRTLATVNTSSGGTFQYRYQDGTSGPLTDTVLIPGEYDDGNGQGAPGSVTNGQWTTQRVYSFTSNAVKIQPGQFKYQSKAESIGGITTEGFVAEPSILANGMLIGYITLRGGGSDLSDPGDASFASAGKFGSTSASSTATTLQAAYDNAAVPTITTSTSTAVTLKNGAVSATDPVLDVTNNSDTSQFTVYGDRVVIGATTTTLGATTIHPTSTPATASATGVAGQVVWDADYIYVCVSTNAWKRSALTTW